MQKYTLTFLLLALTVAAYSQSSTNSYDDIKIYVAPNCRKVYYEGESPSFEVHIDNMANEEKPYQRFFTFWVSRVKEQGGADILKMPKNGFKHPHMGDPYEKEKGPVKYPVEANYKSVHPRSLGFDYFGNVDLTYYIPLTDEDKETYLRKPLFLKPGKYTIEVVCRLFPTEKEIVANYSFEVVPANGNVKEQLMTYLKAMDYTIRNGRNPDVKYLTSETEPTLWRALKDDSTTHYANEIINLMAIELDFRMFCVRNYQDDKPAAFPLFEWIPNLKYFNSIDVGKTYFEWNVHKIIHFKQAGFIADIPSYVDNYLKRIEHLDPIVSEAFIKTADYYLKVPNLRNYAQERVAASNLKK